jgi:transcriptional regulator with XRE-family HTH domain
MLRRGKIWLARAELLWILLYETICGLTYCIGANLARSDAQPEPVDLHVGHRIRIRRKLLGFSQHRLAEDLGLTFQQVQKYERGLNRVSASKLYEISRSLHTSVAYFFEGLANHSEGANNPEAEGIVLKFLATPEGLELAALFPRLKHGLARRRILDLVRAMAEDNEEAA